MFIGEKRFPIGTFLDLLGENWMLVGFFKINFFISGEICLTTNDSADKNAECKFPWKFNGNLLNECTDDTDPDGK